jgi:hypothetical protein
MTHPLLDLNQFAKDHPPRDQGFGTWRERESHELFLTPATRVRIAVDRTSDVGRGLWRDEQLAAAGIFACDADSLAFAERLNATLGEHLSIRNLEHIIQVLARQLATSELERQAAVQHEAQRKAA